MRINFLNAENTAIVLFFIGVYGLCARRNIIKTIISLGIMSGGVILYFLSINRTPESMPPIFTGGNSAFVPADPLPQALVITAIVVGISVTAVALIMFIAMYHKYGTTNWQKALRHRMENRDE